MTINVKSGIFAQAFGQESIGRPGLDAQASVDKVTDLLRKSFNENEMPSITSIFV